MLTLAPSLQSIFSPIILTGNIFSPQSKEEILFMCLFYLFLSGKLGEGLAGNMCQSRRITEVDWLNDTFSFAAATTPLP